jgi:hypothetical protein
MRGVRLALLTLSAVGRNVFRFSGPHTGSDGTIPRPPQHAVPSDGGDRGQSGPGMRATEPPG